MANYNLTQTGAEVQVILDRVAAGYIYMGVADLTTTPDTTNPKVYYLLTAVGTYTNFGNIQHASGIGIALWNGTAWSYQNVPLGVITTSWRTLSDINTIKGFIRPAGTESDNESYLKSDYQYIPEGATKLLVRVRTGSASSSPAVFYKADKSYLSGVTPTSAQASALTDYEIPIPTNAKWVRFSSQQNYVSSAYANIEIPEDNIHAKDIVYISPSGADGNDGSQSAPIATFNRAMDLLSASGTLYLDKGTYENIGFNLGKISNIVGIDNPRILFYNQKITSATIASGYTRVYSIAYTGSVALSNFDLLFQHGLPESGTEIATSERHPLQKNQTHRMLSTRIYKASSIAQIESTTDYPMWYYSGTTLYFSIVSGSTLADNPVIVPQTHYSADWGGNKGINWQGFTIWYVPVSLANSKGALRDVTIGFASKSGYALQCDYCDLELHNCEIFGAHIANGGDGVNTHTQDTTIASRSQVTLHNCWLHDNGDDGESCHENSNTIHYGGLVEYNGNGITPATGAGTQCYNVLCRKNGGTSPWMTDNAGTGFSSQGSSSSPARMQCFGCLSENNATGFRAGSSDTYIAVNCISKNDTTAFSGVTQVNCTTI